MEVVPGAVLFQDVGEGGKSPVGRVLPLVDSFWGSMGDEDIEVSPVLEAGKEETRKEPEVLPVHLPLSVLVGVSVVPVTPFKPGDEDVPVADDPLVEVGPPGEGFLFPWGIVVAVDEKERNVEGGHHKVQVVFGKVPAGDDAVHIPESLFAEGTVNSRINPVAERQNFHLLFIIPISEKRRKGLSAIIGGTSEIKRRVSGYLEGKGTFQQEEEIANG
jgi:hypothetical protein